MKQSLIIEKFEHEGATYLIMSSSPLVLEPRYSLVLVYHILTRVPFDVIIFFLL